MGAAGLFAKLIFILTAEEVEGHRVELNFIQQKSDGENPSLLSKHHMYRPKIG